MPIAPGFFYNGWFGHCRGHGFSCHNGAVEQVGWHFGALLKDSFWPFHVRECFLLSSNVLTKEIPEVLQDEREQDEQPCKEYFKVVTASKIDKANQTTWQVDIFLS